jgi:hypothetical protein
MAPRHSEDHEPFMETLSTGIRLLAFYEIARRANLTNDPNLVNLPAFLTAKDLHDQRAQYFSEAFSGSPEATDDFLKLHLGGILSTENKSWEDIWAEFAPAALQRFPLPPGVL